LYEKSFIANSSIIGVVAMSKALALALVLLFLTTSSTILAVLVSGTIVENTWVAKAPMHQARSGLGVVAVNGKLYAIGGSTVTGSYPYSGGVEGLNEEYDLSSNTWTYKTPMPTPMSEFGIAVYNNKIYCMKDNVNQVYDPITDTWENRTAMPTPRLSLSANVVDGKIYIIGGYDRSLPYGGDATAINEVYDPETDTWSTKAPMLAEKSDYASAVIEDKIYIIGGGSLSQPLLTVTQIYDTKTDSWSYGAPFPYEYLSFRFLEGEKAGVTSGVDAPKLIYIFAGVHETGGETEYLVQIYNPNNDSWTDCAEIPTDRTGFGVAVLDDLFYVIGGETSYVRFPFDPDPATITKYVTNECYTPFRYGTISPIVSVISPQNANYTSNNASLAFTVNKPVKWMGYSLDGLENVTINGNITLTGLSSGSHSVTVYSEDLFGNFAEPQTYFFSIEEGQDSLLIPIVPIIGLVIAVTVIAAGLLLFRRHRKTTNLKQ
jgi:N-acetylneuraminic acid mutarotase